LATLAAAILSGPAHADEIPADADGFGKYVAARLAPLSGDDAVAFTPESVLQLTSRRNGQRVDLLFFDVRQHCLVRPSRCESETADTLAHYAHQLPLARQLRDARDAGDDSDQALGLDGSTPILLVQRSSPPGWVPGAAASTPSGIPLDDAGFSAYLRDRFQLYSKEPVIARGAAYPIVIGRPVGVALISPYGVTMAIPANDILTTCRMSPDRCDAAVHGFIQDQAGFVQTIPPAHTSKVCRMP
jgi:hypothetical protein